MTEERVIYQGFWSPYESCPFHGDDERSKLVERLVEEGVSSRQIQLAIRAAGMTVHNELVAKHRKTCLEDKMPGKVAEADYAVIVRDKAKRAVLAGAARVSVKDGLAAQALLDRRDEKQAERSFMLNLAQLLSGGGKSAPRELIDARIIEHEPVSGLLAPPSMREPRPE